MKRNLLVVALVLGLTLPVLAETLKTATLKLPTIQCGMCEKKITKGIEKLDGLKSIEIDVENKTASVVYDADVIGVEDIEKAISAVGYDANEMKADAKAQKSLHPCCRPGAHD